MSVLDRSPLGLLDRIELGDAHLLGLLVGLEIKESCLSTGGSAHGNSEESYRGDDFANAVGFDFGVLKNKAKVAVLVLTELLELFVGGKKEAEQLHLGGFTVFTGLPANQRERRTVVLDGRIVEGRGKHLEKLADVIFRFGCI